MLAKRILGANHYLGAPAGWAPEKDGKCGHLAIRTQGNPRHGDGWCESAWEPTPAELEALNAGGSIILRIVGWQPPVALYVEAQPRDAVEAPAVESDVTGETTSCPDHPTLQPEIGYGLAGCGYGIYSYCGECGRMLSKTQDRSNVSAINPNETKP